MRILTIVCGLVLVLASLAYASDIYIAQNSAGGNTGADCADAHSASWFNSNAIGGNTYHLCGTFTGTAGSTMLTPPNSGSSGNPVKRAFESGAVLTAPYWGGNGAINVNGLSYITIDGSAGGNGPACGEVSQAEVACNGTIQNSANGTALTYQQPSSGIGISSGSSNIEVKSSD